MSIENDIYSSITVIKTSQLRLGDVADAAPSPNRMLIKSRKIVLE